MAYCAERTISVGTKRQTSDLTMGHSSLKFFLRTDYHLFKGNTGCVRVRDSLIYPEVSAAHTSTPELAHWVPFCKMEWKINLCNSTNSLIFCLCTRTQWIFSLNCPFLSACLDIETGSRITTWSLINPTGSLNDSVCSLETLKPRRFQSPCLLYYQLTVPYKDILREALHCVSNIKFVFIHREKKTQYIYIKNNDGLNRPFSMWIYIY